MKNRFFSAKMAAALAAGVLMVSGMAFAESATEAVTEAVEDVTESATESADELVLGAPNASMIIPSSEEEPIVDVWEMAQILADDELTDVKGLAPDDTLTIEADGTYVLVLGEDTYEGNWTWEQDQDEMIVYSLELANKDKIFFGYILDEDEILLSVGEMGIVYDRK